MLRKFIMDTLKGMIGNYPDFQVREFALGWYSKKELTETDLVEIDGLIVEKNTPPIVEEIPQEEIPQE